MILEPIGRGERVRNFETVRLKKDGSRVDVSVTISAIRDAAGRIVGASKVVRDITDRNRMLAALRRSEQEFRMLFDHNPMPMWVCDMDTMRFLAVNDAAVDHYGYSRDEFLTLSIKDIGRREVPV